MSEDGFGFFSRMANMRRLRSFTCEPDRSSVRATNCGPPFKLRFPPTRHPRGRTCRVDRLVIPVVIEERIVGRGKSGTAIGQMAAGYRCVEGACAFFGEYANRIAVELSLSLRLSFIEVDATERPALPGAALLVSVGQPR